MPRLDATTVITCARCLRLATHYIIKSKIHGELLAVCEGHNEEEEGK